MVLSRLAWLHLYPQHRVFKPRGKQVGGFTGPCGADCDDLLVVVEPCDSAVDLRLGQLSLHLLDIFVLQELH